MNAVNRIWSITLSEVLIVTDLIDPTREPTLKLPLPRSCPFDPSPEYARLRREQPVAPGRMFRRLTWLITRYDDVREALADPRLSADAMRPEFPLPLMSAFENSGLPSFIRMDAPRHDDLRRMVQPDFMVKRVEALRPRIQELVDSLIDDMLKGPKPADLVTAIAGPMPSTVICWLLGVPEEDHEFFQDRSTYMFRRGVTQKERDSKIRELDDYMYELVDRKTTEPGDDIISRLVVERMNSGQIDRRTVQGIAFLLLVAGHETTGNMTALGTLALLEHRDQFEALGEDPSLAPGAVEELLRYLTILDDPNFRVATEDLEIGGQLIKAGDVVRAATQSANRDPDVFPEPDKLDIRRGARNHLAFGFGIHQCLGQPLARVELQVVYETLARRIPTLRLAIPVDDVPYKNDVEIFGVHQLPVTW
ncbi:cytochrome P450 [Rhodococcus wratislaviensis]|uniref:cytochrome P450 n=1 Tax=Rhodococcus wratislaviensis TaxID=44752 RepID=UPI003666789B